MIIALYAQGRKEEFGNEGKVVTTVVWEIFVFNNFRMLKFRTGKFLYNSICTNIFQDDILSLQNFLYVLLERSGSEKTVVFAATTYTATTYTKQYGGKLSERSWSVTESRKTRAIATQYVLKRSGVIIGHLPRKLSRVCSLFLRCGGLRCNIMYGDCRAQILRRSTLWQSKPFRSGRPSFGLKSFRIDMVTTIMNSTKVPTLGRI